MSDVKNETLKNDPTRPERVPVSDLRIEFVERFDREGKRYFLAKTKLPLVLDLANTAFFYWCDDEGGPSMTVRQGREKELGAEHSDEDPSPKK